MKTLSNMKGLLWLALVVGVSMAIGCSGGSGGDDSVAGNQNFVGTFVNNRGAPLAGVPVRIVPTGQRGVTDATGTVQIITDILLNGDVEVQAGNPEVPLTLFGIRRSTDSVLYKVTLDQNARRASITSLSTSPLEPETIALTQNCQDCHGILGEPNCASSSWRQAHADAFRCNPGIGGPASASDNCTFCHGDRGAPQCSNPTWKAIHVMYPCTGTTGAQNTGSWNCTSCHGDFGHAQCGNPNFERNHQFVSCEPGTGDESQLHCNSCHALEKAPRCDDPQWLRDHPFWTCGPRTGSCTSCHEFKGSSRCNDAFWTEVHDFFSCAASAEGLDCSSCHAAEIDTKCGDDSWRSIHNFVGTGVDVGPTNGLCSSCHDNNRGPVQCEDATWTAFHCFCG